MVEPLVGEKALELWRQGKDAWNAWIEEHPGENIYFVGADFREECCDLDQISFEGFNFGDGHVSFSDSVFGNRQVTFRNSIFNGEIISFDYAKFDNGGVVFYQTNFGNGNISFDSTEFGDGVISFISAIFGNGHISFAGTCFGNGDALFDNVRFGNGDIVFVGSRFGKGKVSFNSTQFGDGDISFAGTCFGNGDALFDNVRFGNGDVIFDNSRFGDGVISVDGSQFGDGDISFAGTCFGNGDTRFDNVRFGSGDVIFDNSRFGDGVISFDSSQFGEGNISFKDVLLGEKKVSFSNARIGEGHFIVKAYSLKPTQWDFEAVNIEGQFHFEWTDQFTIRENDQDKTVKSAPISAFSLKKASFGSSVLLSGNFDCIPDLRLCSLSHHLDLSATKVRLKRERIEGEHCSFLHAADKEDSARLRRLKDLAEGSLDYALAAEFSANENRARRWIILNTPSSILDYLFDITSNYGQDILKPTKFLLIFNFLFSTLFFTISQILSHNKQGYITTILESILLSIAHTLPFLPLSQNLIDNLHEALFCKDYYSLVSALGLANGLLSFIFLFLIGLGLRNRFRL